VVLADGLPSTASAFIWQNPIWARTRAHERVVGEMFGPVQSGPPSHRTGGGITVPISQEVFPTSAVVRPRFFGQSQASAAAMAHKRFSACGIALRGLGGSRGKHPGSRTSCLRGSAAIGPHSARGKPSLPVAPAATAPHPRLYLTEPIPTGIANGRYGARLCENVRERRTRSIVFSIVFPQ